jgi:hypothetical protein
MVLPSNPFTEAKQNVLIIDLAIFLPLALFEIMYIQRFKVDRLFLLTATFYSVCFSLRLYFSMSLSNIDMSEASAGTKVWVMIVQTIQKSACLALTYYVLLIEFVKITLEATSPQILAKNVRKQKIIMTAIISTLMTFLVIEAVFGFYMMNGY